jgi:predicted transcriptional regulator
MPRGGKRPGAGGKPIDERARVPVTATLSADLVDMLNRAAGVSGRSRAMLVNDAVEAYRESLESITRGEPVPAAVVTQGHGGYRPGSGQPTREPIATVELSAQDEARLEAAAIRTGRSRSALLAGALAIASHWLETTGLPVFEQAPPALADRWLDQIKQEGSRPYIGFKLEKREGAWWRLTDSDAVKAKPRRLPEVISVRYVAYRHEHPGPAPDVHLVRDAAHGAWLVGEGDDGLPVGFPIKAIGDGGT